VRSSCVVSLPIADALVFNAIVNWNWSLCYCELQCNRGMSQYKLLGILYFSIEISCLWINFWLSVIPVRYIRLTRNPCSSLNSKDPIRSHWYFVSTEGSFVALESFLDRWYHILPKVFVPFAQLTYSSVWSSVLCCKELKSLNNAAVSAMFPCTAGDWIQVNVLCSVYIGCLFELLVPRNQLFHLIHTISKESHLLNIALFATKASTVVSVRQSR